MATETSVAPVAQTPPRPKAPGSKMAADWVKSLNEEPTPSTPPAPTPPPVPVETPKPTQPAPVEEDFEKVLSETEAPKNQKNWERRVAAEKKRLEKLNGQIAEMQKQIAERDEKIKNFKPAGEAPADYDALKNERDELSERLRITDIQNHPRFKAHYEGKVNAQIQLAKRIVGAEKADQLAEILKMPDTPYKQAQVDELVLDLNPMQQSRIGAVLNALADIELDRQQQIETAKSDFDRVQAESKAKTEKQIQEARQTQEALFNETLSHQRKDNFMFQKKDGQDEWNKDVDQREAFAKHLMFSEKDPNRIAQAAFYASAFPAVVKSHVEANDRIAALEKQIAELTAAQPSISPAPKETPGSQPKPRGKKYLGGMEQARGWIDQLNQESQQE